MRVSVEESGALGRRLVVTIPGDRIEEEVSRRLDGVARQAKIKGFRPGKAPKKVVRRQYGDSVRADVLEELVRSHYAQAVTSEKLAPASAPAFQPGETEEDGSYTFTAEFEVYPSFDVQGVDGVRLTRPQVEIRDADVQEVLDRLRRQRADWVEVERAAAKGDRVTIDFEGRIEGEPFEGNQSSDMPLVLGSGQVIPGFEEGLEGAAAGDTRTLDLKFPDDYRNTELAGKPVSFDVKVHRVEEQKLPELDDALAESLGIEEGGIEQLRERVRENMNRELDERVRGELRRQAGDALVEANPIEVPTGLVDEEVARQQRAALQRLGISSDSAQAPQLPREPFVEEAERRVRLGLILSQLIEAEAFRPDPTRIEHKIDEVTAETEDPAAQARAIRADNDVMRRIEALVLEEMAYDWLLDQAHTEDEPRDFFEFMEPKEGQSS